MYTCQVDSLNVQLCFRWEARRNEDRIVSLSQAQHIRYVLRVHMSNEVGDEQARLALFYLAWVSMRGNLLTRYTTHLPILEELA
jgi:hypothetical protein